MVEESSKTNEQLEDSDIKFTIPTPKEIHEHLNQYVIGQDRAKRVLSVAVYNHYKRIFSNLDNTSDIKIDKSNVLIAGETGCGKTFLAKTIAKFLGVPFYIADATSITESGYVGDDVENVIVGLLRAADYDIKRAEIGIVFIDEIDKIAKKGANVSITRDVSGEGVQQGLLKIVEGDIISVPPLGGRKHPHQENIYIDTTNILFISSGSFAGIEPIIEKRIGRNQIGFDNKKTVNREFLMENITSHDIKQFGMIPEFIGRFPIITHVNQLTKEDMAKIMTEPKNSITKQYIQLLNLDGCKLSFTQDAVEQIANVAIELKIGARGLRTIMEDVMEDYMYEAPSLINQKVIITKDYVTNKLSNKYKNIKEAIAA